MRTISNKTRHTHFIREKYFVHNINPNSSKKNQEKRKWDWESKNPYLFLMIWIRNEAPMRFENGFRECLEWRKFREKMNSYKCSREKLKQVLKAAPISAKHTIFATGVSRQRVASSSRQNTLGRKYENFSKCFSRLEGLPASESRAEPRKSLS